MTKTPRNKNRKRSQSGNTILNTILVVVLLAVAVFGFIFVKNYTTPVDEPYDEIDASHYEDTEETEEVPAVEEVTGQTAYTTNSAFAFNYPSSGWSVSETQYGENADSTVELKSFNYEPSIGMGIDEGAIISFSVSETPLTLDQYYADIQASPEFGSEDLKKTTYTGKRAITYHSAYEGVRYHTIFIQNGKAYDIVYRYKGNGQASTYMGTYNLVTSSFSFK